MVSSKTTEKKYEEAMSKLRKFIRTKGVYPYQEDYDRYFTEDEQYQLLTDLGIKDDLDLFRTENPRIAIFAILNIEALRCQRRLEGKDEYITGIEGSSWDNNNKMIIMPSMADF